MACNRTSVPCDRTTGPATHNSQLLSLSQHKSSRNSSSETHTHLPTPLNCVNITHDSLTNGEDDGADNDDKHAENQTASRLYTSAKRTVPSSSVGRANAGDNNLGVF
ncbi:hypothetical protein PIB30_079071 [Stylosanthes scabra]|uniref:Uncharacterized protein n=1 Tax=Stylosanthes scabra TaxID=79078 RepID=A0ABU6QQQ1_9FABA|nr:hypothetical protein [Stylosanthes scabra]